jgi:hypothetical protein
MFGAKSDKPICPLLKKPCIGRECAWHTHVLGKHPQSGSDLDLEDCAVKWLPTLLIETSKETRQAAAAVESLRNENVTTGQQIAGALMQVAASNQQALLITGKQEG